MATRLKPSRINVDNNPRVGDGAAYQNDNDFHWSEGGGDMSYEDFEWVTLTGNSLVIENISNNVTPTGDFTVTAGTLRPGIEYVLRVNTGNTPYTMTLGTGVTNPNGYSTELTPNKVNQFKFIATSDSQLELDGVDTSEYLTGLTILSYGTSTWNDFITAYNKNAIVYCRASSNSNPATGAQNRLAFMAYVNNATNPTEVEFQYYRSRSSHSIAQNQQDEVYVYKLTSTSGGTWTVEIRDTAARIATGTGLTDSYTTSAGITTMTIANDGVLTVNGNKGTVTVNDIKQSATEPSDKTAGTAWYDTTNGALKVYNGSAWDTIATGGAISDTAYGPGWDGQTTTAPSQNAVYDKISSIDALIPSEATSSNKLADKAFVGDSINSVTAYYITKNANGDQFATYAELAAATTFYSGGVVRVPTMNDYTIVLDDENHDHATTRYIYNSGWEYQYTINETPLTQAQLNALNSGITAGKVSTYDGYATSKQDKLVNQSNIKSINNNSLLGSGNLTLNDVKVSSTEPSPRTEGMVWYDTTNDQLKVYDGTNWNAVRTGLSDIVYATQAEYNALLPGALTDNKHYFIYTSPTPPTPREPGVNTLAYYHIESDDDTTIHDRAGNNNLSYPSNAYITDADAGIVANLAGQNYATGNVVNMGTEYTEIAWVYQYDNTNNQSIFTQNASSSRYPSAGLLTRDGYIASVSMNDAPTNIQFPTNAWTMIGWTRNSNGDMKLYLNGEYQMTVPNTDTPDYSGGEGFYLGLWRTTYYQWKGYFKTLILENKERDASEFSSYYNQTKGDFGIS